MSGEVLNNTLNECIPKETKLGFAQCGGAPLVIDGLLPAIVQDYYSGRVLMLAYVNQESYDYMLAHGCTCFWSRSRQELWPKGETSGDTQEIKNISFDCDQDTLLIQVKQNGKGACHTGSYSCFGPEEGLFDVIGNLFTEIQNRATSPAEEKSYTSYLLNEGVDKICKKVGEEAAETIIAAKNASKPELIGEASDLLYHLLVLLYNQGLAPVDVLGELAKRRKVEGNKKPVFGSEPE
ncbi:MAG: bifunctional phosphoribosyl-AMP cyclohydrolase/phosphoribosyl-ATP diphosphatase HisIE [Defluviitaleaceae bacterium]|nr:bifunctional phosphoribosyl-AMP cyclohydrolase/phosphoribosyl-ATP diphosphatase HisIE [Defluviitaleaceae bacterium]